MNTVFLIFTLFTAHAVDLKPPRPVHEDRTLPTQRPKRYEPSWRKNKKDSRALSIGIKSSIPGAVVADQIQRVDTFKPGLEPPHFDRLSNTIKNSTNGVDVKLRF